MSDELIEEYLRRNYLQAKAVGALSLVKSITNRATSLKRPPKWLLRDLNQIEIRIRELPHELALHRDEVKP